MGVSLRSFSNVIVSFNQEIPGYSVSQTEPSFLRHPVSTEIQRLMFQDGGVDTVPHGLCSMPVRVSYGIGGYSVKVIPSLSNFLI